MRDNIINKIAELREQQRKVQETAKELQQMINDLPGNDSEAFSRMCWQSSNVCQHIETSKTYSKMLAHWADQNLKHNG